jgi:hypothetical protein
MQMIFAAPLITKTVAMSKVGGMVSGVIAGTITFAITEGLTGHALLAIFASTFSSVIAQRSSLLKAKHGLVKVSYLEKKQQR